MDGKEIKNKYLQIDLLRRTSGMLKVASCMDEDSKERINEIITRLDYLSIDLEDHIADGAPRNVRNATPILTVV